MSPQIDRQVAPRVQPFAPTHVNWLLVLNRLSRKVNLAPEEVERTLHELLHELADAIGASAAAIWTREPDTDFLMIYAESGLSERFSRFFNKTDRIKIGHGLVGEVMQNRRTQYFSSLNEYADIGVQRWFDVVSGEGIEAILAAPLFVGEELYGTINLYYHKKHEFSEPEVLTAETLANQIAVIFENRKQSERLSEDSRLYKKQRDELVSIQTVVRSVDSTIYTKRDESIKELSQYIQNTYRGHGVLILHAARQGDRPTFTGSHNLSEVHRAYVQEKSVGGSFSKLVDAVYESKKPLCIDRVFTSEYIEKEWSTILSNERIVALTAFPLMVQDRVVGVYVVFYDHLHGYIEDEISVLNTLGQFLAVSLENVSIFNALVIEKRTNEAMIESLKDGLIVFGLSGQVIDLNPAAVAMLGLRPEVVDALQRGGTKTSEVKNVAHVASLAIPAYKTIQTSVSTPEERILEVTHVPLKDENFADISTMYILHDVTEEHRIQELKSNFVGTATHQMRTPITSIRWGLNALASGDLGELNAEQKKMITGLADTNAFVLSLVNDLLNVSRVEQLNTSDECESINLCILLKDLIKNESIASEKKKLTVSVTCSHPVMPFYGSKTDIALAFQNLLDNAIKYSNDNGSITITLKQKEDNLVITVADTGIGISLEDQRLLFNKFFRGKNAVLVETDGSGLGLFLAREIIEGHGGSISVTSELNKGTMFHIVLPKDRAFCRPAVGAVD